MSFNIMDLVKDQLSDQVMGQLGNVIGGSASQNESALSSAIPGLLNGLINSGATDTGAGALFNTINDQDDSILDNLGDLLGGSNQSSMMDMGTKALGSLLGGGGLGNLVGAISGFSGAGKSGTSSLLGLLAPIVFGIVKRKLLGGGGGFDVGSLMGMLNGQKDNVAASMPSGFSDVLNNTDFDKISSGVSEAADNVTDSGRAAANEGKSLISKLLPLALLIGAGLIAYNLFFKGGNETETSTGANTSQMETMDATGVTRELKNTMDGLTASFGSITDVASAKAALPSLTSAADSLGGLAGMVDKLPAAARGPITQMVSGGIPQLQELINKVSAIPGVGDVIRPVVESIAAKLAMFK